MQVTGLFRYPLKSARGQPLTQAQIGPDGIAGDRVWMLVDEDGDQITARACPSLLRLIVDNDHLTFPGAAPIRLPSPGPDRAAQLFEDDLIVANTPPALSDWLSRTLNRPAHLVAATPRTTRGYGGGAYGGFGDLAPVLITGTASLTHLNGLAPLDMDMARFRPNIVVQTDTPFEEDHWQTLQIGDVLFDVVEPCVRCNFTYLHPETGQRDVTCEPLRSLSAFHADAQGGICFGVYAVPRGSGAIARGDPVEITATTQRRFERTDSPFAPPDGRRALRITSITRAAERAVHVTLAFDDGQPTQIIPGQFAALHIALPGGEDITRCYTVSQIAGDGRILRISVRHEADGLISGWLNGQARVGDTLWTSGIFGELTAPADPVLCLSAGSGITPFLAMGSDLPGGSHHLHYERDAASVIGRDELVQNAGFQLMLTPKTGRITRAHLPACDLSRLEARICGPAGFVETAQQILLECGMAQEKIRVESFAALPVPEGGAETHEIRLDEATIPAPQNETILTSLRRNGVKVASACEVGSCGTCRLRLVSGDVRSMRQASDAGFVLSCCSYPRSDLVLDAGS